MRKIFLLLQLLPLFVFGQQNDLMNSSEILSGIKKLNVVGSVLYIAAHPDDENTRLITYLSKERNIRTAYLSLTRGDGGQNLVGKEQAEMLGLLRTQELLAARRIDGGEQFFSRANDFGYSKTPEETFRIWNKDSILSDVVWVIRNFKPDVIICRFPTTGEGGHGHHTASAILAAEAFDAAADPKKFPAQLKYTSTWQPKRVFWNVFNPGFTNAKLQEPVQIDVGNYNSLLGKYYGEIAADGRSMHKSQGFGSSPTRGSVVEYFRLMKGDSVSADPLEGIDMTWNRIQGGSAIQKMISDCIHWFDPQSPEKSVTPLMAIYLVIKNLPENDQYTVYWKKQKMKEIENLLLSCSGIWMEASAGSYSAIPGKKVEFSIQFVKGTDADVKIQQIKWLNGEDTITSIVPKKNELLAFKHSEILPSNIAYSNPYWLNKDHSEGLFNVTDQLLIGKPENNPPAFVTIDLMIQDVPFKIVRPLIYKSTDPVKGEVYRPFEILPPVTVNFHSRAFAFRSGSKEKVQIEIKSNTDSINGQFKINVPKEWTVEPEFISYSLRKNEVKFETVTVTSPAKQTEGFISAVTSGDTILKSIRRIEYDHVPYQFTLGDARSKVVSFEINEGVKNIGYIPGAGDDVAASLKQLGYHVVILDEDAIEKEDLSKFDAIVTGIRAYNTNEWLMNEYERLMNYVKQGGNLIVQYNTNSRIGPLNAKISPYPFTISRERVTDENAEVRFINPSHPVLNYPNKISTDDFKGWKQERGIYFATETDSAYEKIFSMNDVNEKPSDGSLIIGKYGKGNFVYTGIVFFRELPAGVPGAYRLFANLLSLGKN